MVGSAGCVLGRCFKTTRCDCLLLAAQCHESGIDARRVAGFRTWLKLGRSVRKGEKGLVVLAPIPIKRREDGEERDEARVVFRVEGLWLAMMHAHAHAQAAVAQHGCSYRLRLTCESPR